MPDHNAPDWFDNLDAVIAEPLKFKAKLCIGEDAYTSLRLKKGLGEIWNITEAAGIGAVIANSSIVAPIFSSGFMVFLGLGATPIGWIIAAATVSGGACFGLMRYLEDYKKEKIDEVPRFINSPLDVLAVALFDLMASLALKLAASDSHINELERSYIKNHFINDWGYDEEFVGQGIKVLESRLTQFKVANVAYSLSDFQKGNKDCNSIAMAKEINHFLQDVIELDGKIDKRKEAEIKKVTWIFSKAGKQPFPMYNIFSRVKKMMIFSLEIGKYVYKKYLNIRKS